MSDSPPSALKEMFNADRYRHIAGLLADAVPGFDRKRFLAIATVKLSELSLLQRMRRMTEACRATLPGDYLSALEVLSKIAPRVDHGFVSIFLCDFVGLYGHDHFQASMDALKYFTRTGSAEFAIREFLKRDLSRTLVVMHEWSKDPDEHLRRLACEGCRPRLPWSFRLETLVADPSPVSSILENLKSDPSRYVRKSVANHLNDISKDHPDWLFAMIGRWPEGNVHTTWIIRHALRTLIKRGDQRALAVIGASRRTEIKLADFKLTPGSVKIGCGIHFSFQLKSRGKAVQRLIVDYAVHYMKSSGKTAPKVFKLRELTLAPGTTASLSKQHRLQELTTRRHYPGRHRLEIMVNGKIVGGGNFLLFSAG